ncbi:MAG: SGNH/GDSL hydrolase family protein [Rariglobus sp.]
MYNRGCGGNTTALALDRIKTDVLSLMPSTVLIEFGINDGYVNPWCLKPRVGLTEYVRNLGEIVDVVRRHHGTPVVIINHPAGADSKFHWQGNGRTVPQNQAPYTTAARRFTTKNGIACIDLPRLIRTARIDPGTLLAEDKVHLSITGNRIYAGLIASSLKRVVPNLFKP